MKKTVLLGITSGIAAYKVVDLIKLLKSKNLDVIVTMTKSASEMVSIKEIEDVAKNEVLIDLFEKDFNYKTVLKDRRVKHIEIADKADLMVIAPATANVIGKLGNGIADDFLTTTALAITKPIILCPSMNVNMWNNPIVQQNLNRLKNLGHIVIEPAEGMLACGYEGKGRLADINYIANEIENLINKTSQLKDKKIIVTTGGTIEKIDNVRFISNRSSGKMGVALAEELYLRGAEVLLISAENSITPRYLIRKEIFKTSNDLFSLLRKNLKKYDVIYHVAAVSDFSVKNLSGKISSENAFNLKLIPQLKLINEIKKINPKIKLIAFKAEYNLGENELIKKAINKLEESNANIIIANDISRNDRGFESDNNEVYMIFKNGHVKKIPLMSKKNVAKNIINYSELI